MQASRVLISTLTALGVVGLASLAVAQTSTTTPPGAVTATTPGGTTTTITPPSVTTSTETDAERMTRERMDRERMDRERLDRERLNARTSSDGVNQSTGSSSMDSTARRDANGDLIARADRN